GRLPQARGAPGGGALPRVRLGGRPPHDGAGRAGARAPPGRAAGADGRGDRRLAAEAPRHEAEVPGPRGSSAPTGARQSLGTGFVASRSASTILDCTFPPPAL